MPPLELAFSIRTALIRTSSFGFNKGGLNPKLELELALNLSGLCAAVVTHKAVARFGIETTRAGVGLSHDTVHVGGGGQAFKVFATLLDVERADGHAVEVDNVEVYASVG